MQATLHLPRVSVIVNSESQKGLFKELAAADEVFGEKNCGMCKSENIHFKVRTVEENDYYELTCDDCFAKLSYGQNKKGNTIFPKRKLADNGKPDQEHGRYNKTAGWTKFRGEGNTEAGAQTQS